jgi:hypothetical protein
VHVCHHTHGLALACVCCVLRRWTAEALHKYMKSTRSEAPYLPSNVQYVANNNALASKEDVSVWLCVCVSVWAMRGSGAAGLKLETGPRRLCSPNTQCAPATGHMRTSPRISVCCLLLHAGAAHCV